MKSFLTLFAVIVLGVSSFAQAPAKPIVNIYNPKANAESDINAAVAKAKKEKKHVLIQVGGNWCIWCIKFHDLVASTPALKKLLDDNYETVLLNYSPENKNEVLLKKFNYPGRFGFPVFLVLDGDGKLIHTQNSGYLEEGNGHSVPKVTEFLKGWSYSALQPENNK